MIKNQWYAVMSSKQIPKGKTVAVKRFGEKLIFFRNMSGKLACVTSLCAHRGASLEKGCVKNGHIQCPFHGIEYDTEGKCVYVPSEGRASKLDFGRFDLKHYSLREIGGIVFVWYGDTKPETEPDCFDIITDPSYTYDHTEDTWSVHYSRVIENQLDVSHLAFVHRTTIGRGNKTLSNGPKVVWTDDNTLQTSANNEKDMGQTPKSADESIIKSTNLNFKFPNMWLNHISDKIMILAYFVPVDDEKTVIALRFYNKITPFKPVNKIIAWLGSRANKVVERQDKRIVETQLPKASSKVMKENLVAADLPIIEYRTKRQELIDGGADGKKALKEKTLSNVPDKEAMYKLSYGLFVVSVRNGVGFNACIANTAIQAASVPNQISFAINKMNYTHDLIMQSGECNISVLSEAADFDIFKRFGFQSGRDIDKFEGFNGYEVSSNGLPYITVGCNSYFSLKITKTADLGSHTLFVAEPSEMKVLSEIPSATYTYYQENIKPKPEAVGKTADGKTVWRCRICGYEYTGEDLPEDYICPVCKHGAEDFEKI